MADTYKTLNNDGQPQQASAPPPPQPEVGFCFRLFVRIVASVAGVLAIILGLISLITVKGMCIVAGIYIILLGFLTILLEAPFCCQFLDITDKVSKWSERRAPWQKALFYLLGDAVKNAQRAQQPGDMPLSDPPSLDPYGRKELIP
ncbi:calcium channel flower homolog isoform X2 [Strongylocentrotus purpuratus]|uniref:Calcium channel flower n=1 Tax=Strongylocentrotus purpuratus TaxID=7668 RepID=A0A7M7HM31_STRPU|nr:calcium channel flower homolog isoform X2 [Strongylocentrotus purpuratus]|eukprot:XP_011671878.1 PREDICTED: calcium channel flower homolog isoform X2 [Strongylocentrotus purpuratus]